MKILRPKGKWFDGDFTNFVKNQFTKLYWKVCEWDDDDDEIESEDMYVSDKLKDLDNRLVNVIMLLSQAVKVFEFKRKLSIC